jgi:hypothetical protein
MKIITAVCCAALLSFQAMASDRDGDRDRDRGGYHPGPGQPSAQQLGAVWGVISYCSRVDPQHEERYEHKLRTVFPNVSEDAFERARQTPDFHRARETIESILNQNSRADGVQSCIANL